MSHNFTWKNVLNRDSSRCQGLEGASRWYPTKITWSSFDEVLTTSIFLGRRLLPRCFIHFSDLSNRYIVNSDPRYTPRSASSGTICRGLLSQNSELVTTFKIAWSSSWENEEAAWGGPYGNPPLILIAPHRWIVLSSIPRMLQALLWRVHISSSGLESLISS